MNDFFLPTSKSLLARNTIINLIGLSLPLFVGIIAIPLIIRGLGTDRFGILSLVWIILGYAGVFDLGLGRATTKFVASALSQGEKNAVPSIFWTAVVSQLILGTIASILVILLTPFFTQKIIKIPEALVSEARTSFYLLALTVPVVLLQGSFSGLLEVLQRFELINAVKVPASALTFIIAAIAPTFGFGLPTVILLLFVSRIIAASVLLIFCLRIFPFLRSRLILVPKLLRHLLSFGGWVTISNVLAPLLVYLDRFLIGSLHSVGEVAFYTAPYDIVTKLWILPTSLVMTLFPVFSSLDKKSKEDLNSLFTSSLKYLLIIMAPIILILSLLAKKILWFWLGPEFALRSSFVIQLLSWGVLINSMAHLPFTLLQGLGRPDLPAKFHLIEVPLYTSLAWYLINRMGINGAALAWTCRVTFDALLLYLATIKVGSFSFSAFSHHRIWQFLGLFLLLAIFCFLAMFFQHKPIFMFLMIIICLGAFYVAIWKFILRVEEKDFIHSFFHLKKKITHVHERI